MPVNDANHEKSYKRAILPQLQQSCNARLRKVVAISLRLWLWGYRNSREVCEILDTMDTRGLTFPHWDLPHIPSDFQNISYITPILPHLIRVKGLGGACIYATGLRTIELYVGMRQCLVFPCLPCALTPHPSTQSHQQVCQLLFHDNFCWIMNQTG